MGADEEGMLERLKALRRALLDPKIAAHHGRIPGSSPGTKTIGDGLLPELASAGDAVRCAVAVRHARRNQFSQRSPSIRANSASLSVTIAQPSAMA